MKIRGLLLLAAVCSASVYSQAVVGFATVTGIVHDYTGSGIPDTTVTLTNDGSGVKREMDTTDDGAFYASALTPASGYVLKVTRKGFVDLVYKNLDVPAGHTLDIHISLAQDPSLARDESQKASIHIEDVTNGVQYTLDSADLSNLPSRNRDPLSLVPITPGAIQNPESGQTAFLANNGTSAIWTDGVLTTNTYYFNKPPVAPPVTQDALSAMEVVSVGAPAEFGHSFGGTMNLITPTSGNTIHGTVYGYYNTNNWNAADRFAPDFHPGGYQHQVGASAGGPLPLLRKVFWFANFDYLDRRSQGLNLITNPLLVNPAGTEVLTSSCTATAAQCAAAASFINLQLNRVVNTQLQSYGGLAKADWRPNAFNSISVEADAGHHHSPNGNDGQTVTSNGGLLGYNGTYSDDTRFAKASYTAVWSGDAVNEIRGAWYHDRLSDYPNSSLLPSTGAIGLNIAGTEFGGNPNLPFALSEQRYQIVDNFTASVGSHLLKLGIDYSKNEDYNRQVIGGAGDYFFPTLTAFATDYTGNTTSKKDYSTYTQTFGQPVVDLHTSTLGVYAQDTWTPIRRLSVVIGILWEKPFIPQPVFENSTFFQTATIPTPDINFAPRLGLAYRINDKTVVRAGVGAYYQPFSGQLLQTLWTGNGVNQLPFVVVPSQTNSPIFPRTFGTVSGIPAGSYVVNFAEGKLRSPIAADGTVMLERRLTNDMTISVGYLYSRGISLYAQQDTNLNLPTVTKTYTIDNSAGAAVGSYSALIYNTKTNTGFSHVYQVTNGGMSTYHGAIAQLTKRMSYGITAQASYTWSKAVDDVSGSPTLAGFIPSNSVPSVYLDDKGTSSFNQKNRGTINWTWSPTFAKGNDGLGRFLINGWHVSGIASLFSGLPETPLVMVNGQQFTGTAMVYPTSLNGSGGWARVPFEGVNSLSTGPEYVVDARVTRDLPFTERVRAALIFEAFNALNSQFNTSVNTLAYLATSGVLHPIPGVGVGNGASGYPWGDNGRHLQVALKIMF